MRTALFPKAIYQKQAAVWRDQDRIFSKESLPEKHRPIWIHAGDSLSSAWANKSSLLDRLEFGSENGSAPIQDIWMERLQHPSNSDQSWFASPKFGFHKKLQDWSQEPWIIISTALVGAFLGPRPLEDALHYITEVKEKDRVRLLTLSLGSNDLCVGSDGGFDLLERIQKVKQSLPPDTLYLVWDLPDLNRLYQSILARLEKEPESAAKKNLINYCKRVWTEANCPHVLSPDMPKLRDYLRQTLRAEFGQLFDMSRILENEDLLEMVASDCFHPSAQAQIKLADFLFEDLKKLSDQRAWPKRQP